MNVHGIIKRDNINESEKRIGKQRPKRRRDMWVRKQHELNLRRKVLDQKKTGPRALPCLYRFL